MMVGRDVDIRIDKEPANTGEILLEVKNANYTRNDGVQAVKNISFNLKKGEILGIAGVEGNGQTELIRMITGISKKDSGEITIDGRTIPENVTPAFCRKAGLSHIPADRMHRGIAPDSSIEDNIISDRFNQPPFANTNIFKQKSDQILWGKNG